MVLFWLNLLKLKKSEVKSNLSGIKIEELKSKQSEWNNRSIFLRPTLLLTSFFIYVISIFENQNKFQNLLTYILNIHDCFQICWSTLYVLNSPKIAKNSTFSGPKTNPWGLLKIPRIVQYSWKQSCIYTTYVQELWIIFWFSKLLIT